MFHWYQDAAICHAYLSDLAADADMADDLPLCRWFTRGWTLQELLAPASAQFYDGSWTLRGTKDNLGAQLEAMTGIPARILSGHVLLGQVSIGARMSWAANRVTTRLEDVACCLLGIFDVNMPLIYGEGMKAFRRLQEEIIRQSNDLSIFAWQEADKHGASATGSASARHRGELVLGGPLLAPSPQGFRFWTRPTTLGSNTQLMMLGPRCAWTDINPEYAITNKGLRIRTFLLRPPRIESEQEKRKGSTYYLTVGEVESTDKRILPADERILSADEHASPAIVGVLLHKIGPNIFLRTCDPLLLLRVNLRSNQRPATRPIEFHIELDDNGDWWRRWPSVQGTISILTRTDTAPGFRNSGFGGGRSDALAIVVELSRAVPQSHWNRANQEFFRLGNSSLVLAASFIVRSGGYMADVLCLVDQAEDRPSTCLLNMDHHPGIAQWFYSKKAATEETNWEVLQDLHDSSVPALNTDLCVTLGQRQYMINSRIGPHPNPHPTGSAASFGIQLNVR